MNFARLGLHPGRERPMTAVPKPALALLAAGLVLQIVWHGLRPPLQARAEDLPPPPSAAAVRATSLDEGLLASKLLMLWLQAFDNPPGISIAFRDLDYTKVIAWLSLILDLDPRGQYPLLAAARLYGEIPVPDKQRQMFDFVYQEFLKDPDHRWPWLAQAVISAQHRIKDPQLALRYAQALAEHARGPNVPHWAQQMHIFILEDLGEVESAQIVLGGLLDSGTLTDPAELRFLQGRLDELEKRAGAKAGR
jgi:hypothetical protein